MAMEEYDPMDMLLDIYGILKQRIKTKKLVDLSESDYDVPAPKVHGSKVTWYNPQRNAIQAGGEWHDAEMVLSRVDLIILMCHVLAVLGKNYMIKASLKQ